MDAIVVKKRAFVERRMKQGLSLKSIAERANVHYATVNRIENGKTNVNPVTAKAVCDALGVQFDEVFEIVEKN